MLDSNEMHAAVDARLHEDEWARHWADYVVDAATDVTDLVPAVNFRAVAADPWLSTVAATFGTMDLPDVWPLDPIYIYGSSLDAPRFYFLGKQPDGPRPVVEDCARCSAIDLMTIKRRVERVLIPFGLRVIDLRLCAGCVAYLGVEPS